MHGSRGFNALAAGLPGVSRSVLTRRLRKLEELGLIARDPFAASRTSPYRLAPAGEQLVPTLLSLDSWARRWVPEDPALAQRDPDVVAFWLANRVDPTQLPERQTVVVFDIGGAPANKHWLVLERGAPPSICLEDPGLAADRYVYVEAEAAALYPISRGFKGGRRRSPSARSACTVNRRSLGRYQAGLHRAQYDSEVQRSPRSSSTPEGRRQPSSSSPDRNRTGAGARRRVPAPRSSWPATTSIKLGRSRTPR